MNERIKELAEQAGFCHDINNGIYLCAPIHMENFAELIVRECMEVIEDSEGYSQYFPHVTKNIEKHFGVEE